MLDAARRGSGWARLRETSVYSWSVSIKAVFCSLLEAVHAVGIGGDRRWEDFDGDRTVQPRVTRAIHFSHAPFADMSEDLMRPEYCGGKGRGDGEIIDAVWLHISSAISSNATNV